MTRDSVPDSADAASPTLPEHVTTGSTPRATSLPKLLLRVAVGLALLVGGVFVIARWFHEPLEAIGRGFVQRFGVPGMVFGTMIADGLHFPIPPQFYMLMGITSGVPTWITLTAVNLGSFLGGWLAYFLSFRIARFAPIAARLAEPRRLTAKAFARYGQWSTVVVSFMPITYSALCYLAGLSRLPKRGFAVISLIRIPRLIAYYYLVKLGWFAS